MNSNEASPLRTALDNLVAKWRQDDRCYSATQLEHVLAQFPSSLGVEAGTITSPLREALDDLMATWHRQQRPNPVVQLREVLTQFTRTTPPEAFSLPVDLAHQLAEFVTVAQDFRRQAESFIDAIDEGGCATQEALSVRFDRDLQQLEDLLARSSSPSGKAPVPSSPRC